jgi:hydrogenase nickel incorporation protein HypA/HybF
MHELSMMRQLVAQVAEHAERLGARQVVAVNLAVGEHAGFADDALRFAFEALTPGTVAEGARLNVRRPPARFLCPRCRADYHPGGADFRCPRCGTVGRDSGEGSELLIESLEVAT